VAVTETSVDALPSAACVLAGAGGSTKTALELADEFERVGVDALMVMPPMHASNHEPGLLDYYRKLAEGTDLPLVPYVRGFDPSVDFLADLTELPGVVGVKYAIEDVPKFAEAVVAGDNDVVWVDGMAEPYAPALYVEGAEGFTAGVSNFEPRIGLALLEALEDGDFERAKSIRDVTLPYQNLRSERGADNVFPGANSIPAVKYGLELAGLHGGPVREPLVGLSEADEKRAAERYERIEAFVENEL
jgi:4-hydroxy-tetrahydrodipicolinate synthase